MDSLQKRAFDLSALPESVDLSVPPVSGLDYLYRVRLEASNCPQVVVSNIDRTRFLSRQTVTVDICNGFVLARPGFEPDPAWQAKELDTFRSMKAHLSENKQKLIQKFPQKECSTFDRGEWSLFCLGSELNERLRARRLAEEKGGTPSPKKPRLQRKGTPPLLSVVLHLSQFRLIRLLRQHISWMEQIGFSHIQGQWLYGLLMCLEKPLDPSTHALLRSLSRVCSRLRYELPDCEHEFLRPLNLILCIVANCFDQKDMSDGFVAAQAKD